MLRTSLINSESPISTIPKKEAAIKTIIKTTIVPANVSLRDGHVTRLSSNLTSFKNWVTFCIVPAIVLPSLNLGLRMSKEFGNNEE